MRAALVSAAGAPPEVADVPAPPLADGDCLVQVAAARLNPVDLMMAADRFPGHRTTFPYVPGSEGVGTVLEGGFEPGTRIWWLGGGTLGERAVADPRRAVVLPPDLDDVAAASIGIPAIAAWISLRFRARLEPGESVLVLGANGAVGRFAVQIAAMSGAGRVVAVARGEASSEQLLAFGASAYVDAAAPTFERALTDAVEGGADVVLDPLSGPIAAAAVGVSAPHARVVHVGTAAGPELVLNTGLVIGRRLSLSGYGTQGASEQLRAEAYAWLATEAAAGRLRLTTEECALEEVPARWRSPSSGGLIVQV